MNTFVEVKVEKLGLYLRSTTSNGSRGSRSTTVSLGSRVTRLSLGTRLTISTLRSEEQEERFNTFVGSFNCAVLQQNIESV